MSVVVGHGLVERTARLSEALRLAECDRNNKMFKAQAAIIDTLCGVPSKRQLTEPGLVSQSGLHRIKLCTTAQYAVIRMIPCNCGIHLLDLTTLTFSRLT